MFYFVDSSASFISLFVMAYNYHINMSFIVYI